MELRRALQKAGVEFIAENGEGLGRVCREDKLKCRLAAQQNILPAEAYRAGSTHHRQRADRRRRQRRLSSISFPFAHRGISSARD